jgi:hypothetical protein
MNLFTQIFYGSLMLGLCLGIHLMLFVVTISLLKSMTNFLKTLMSKIYWTGLVAVAIVMIVLTHTIQVWIWALAFVLMSALPNINDAVYFALVTYTTLGYGDITIADDLRIFCSMAAVTGLLSFGLSAAFLVELLTRFMPKKL